MPDLIQTKFFRPPITSTVLPRPNLSNRLNKGLELKRSVTLASAPAGYGKTTCISTWVSDLDSWRVAWLSLDSTDNDPGRFYLYFFAALQRVNSRLGKEIVEVLQSGSIPSTVALGTALINDILDVGENILLVLDDFHVIQEPHILKIFELLLANMPPNLHLVLVTREDPPLPLAGMRARNQLTEMRAKDLRFSKDEAVRFLNDSMGLSLTQTDIAELERKTEGWIVGLQLAGLSIKDQPDPSSFISGLSGGHRFILSYLTEQVLGSMPDETQAFLKETSILSKLTGDLCDAVTGRSDGHAILEWLYGANLFLIPLDDEGCWYRYHHLFLDLLKELSGEELRTKGTELHRRACGWYRQQGMMAEAIRHALTGKSYSEAGELIEGHAMPMVMKGEAKTLNGWLEAMPGDFASKSPKTNLAFAWMHLLRGAYKQASSHLENVERDLEISGRITPSGDDALLAEWLVMQALLLNMRGQTEQSTDSALRALQVAPETGRRVRGLANYALAAAYQAQGEHVLAAETFQEAIQDAREANNPVTFMLSTAGGAALALDHGRLDRAYEILEPVVTGAAATNSPPPISTVVYSLMGEIHCQRHELGKADENFRHALHLSELGGYRSGEISCHVLLSRLRQLQGEMEEADWHMRSADALLRADTPPYVRQEALAQKVRLLLAMNRRAAAELVLNQEGFSFQDQFDYPDIPSDRGFTDSLGLLFSSALRTLLHDRQLSSSNVALVAGFELVDRLVSQAINQNLTPIALEALLLRGQIHELLGNSGASEADFLQALELAVPEGYISIFLEHDSTVDQALLSLLEQDRGGVPESFKNCVMASIGSKKEGARPQHRTDAADTPVRKASALAEPLTERELEVLELMAEGLTYKQIAERLFVTLNTVRFHVKSLYGKLGVNNRTQAISRARELLLL